jgi:GTPase SAR1 family protein
MNSKGSQMLGKKIVILGAPMVGKTELIVSLSEVTGSSKPQAETTEVVRFVRLHVVEELREFRFITIQGPFLDREKVITDLLFGVDAVVYVIAPSPETGQERIFEELVSYAKNLGVAWEEVPWVFVLNKVDISEQSPMISKIPETLQGDIVHCIATTGYGVQNLWNRIQSLF